MHALAEGYPLLMEKRTHPRPDATEVTLFLAMCAVLTIAGCVLVQGIASGAPPGAAAVPGTPRASTMSPLRVVQAQPAGTTGEWRRGPALPTERAEVAATAVEDTVYVLGGLAPDGRSLTTVEALAPDATTWQPRAPLP